MNRFEIDRLVLFTYLVKFLSMLHQIRYSNICINVLSKLCKDAMMHCECFDRKSSKCMSPFKIQKHSLVVSKYFVCD